RVEVSLVDVLTKWKDTLAWLNFKWLVNQRLLPITRLANNTNMPLNRAPRARVVGRIINDNARLERLVAAYIWRQHDFLYGHIALPIKRNRQDVDANSGICDRPSLGKRIADVLIAVRYKHDSLRSIVRKHRHRPLHGVRQITELTIQQALHAMTE